MKPTFPHPPKDIEREIETLQNNYREIIKNVGKFVLIQGNAVVNYFNSYREALATGYKQFGLESFLVRPVKKNDVPVRVMRCGIIRLGSRLRLAKSRKG